MLISRALVRTERRDLCGVVDRFRASEAGEQTRPGGLILTTIGGWLGSSELARLTVHDDGTATGSLLSGQVSFMLARPHMPPSLGLLPDLSEGKEREAIIGTDALNDWTSRFVVQLAAPHAQHLTMERDGRTERVLVDVESGSWAALDEEDGRWIVRQDGPNALWDAVEEQLGRWRAAGTPALEEFTVSVTPQGQTINWQTPRPVPLVCPSWRTAREAVGRLIYRDPRATVRVLPTMRVIDDLPTQGRLRVLVGLRNACADCETTTSSWTKHRQHHMRGLGARWGGVRRSSYPAMDGGPWCEGLHGGCGRRHHHIHGHRGAPEPVGVAGCGLARRRCGRGERGSAVAGRICASRYSRAARPPARRGCPILSRPGSPVTALPARRRRDNYAAENACGTTSRGGMMAA
ncbi:hypothetical protein [Streptomyces mirabilis]